jgi:CheY-like chemotaxis protein
MPEDSPSGSFFTGGTVDSLKVLVVDDDASIRSFLRIALSIEEGVGEVREADDGSAALGVLRDFGPDLVVLDYSMGHIDGREVAWFIRARYPRARIVAFSGLLDEKPDWADYHFVKGRLSGIDRLIEETLREPSISG